ncbi:putative late blight resistance protein homolog R1A-3 isoform X3 [Salvia hispanica]|uniref:putative late blight resistance protein homolog R1A-3 isoform X3 n=1 Tax=Salvia hispanica TaxID=49212 RepID=UPI0020096375|nr:putative late blight resistance protein homolog R1A-3 isoform X3 [Salvia hispanica]
MVLEAESKHVEDAIRCGGLAPTKSSCIKNLLSVLLEKRGKLCMEYLREMSIEEVKAELSLLKGIGPKTVSCVLLFNLQHDDFPVDTHIFQIAKRMGWVPGVADVKTTYLHLNQRIPPELKFDLNCLLYTHAFLEGYSSRGGYTQEEDLWESRIAEAAYAAEDVIESYIVDQILARSTNHSSTEFHQGLQSVMEEMDSIKMEVMEIKKMRVKVHLHFIKSPANVSLPRSTQKVTMVGFDDSFYQMLEKIIRGRLDRQIIPITGMGGIGKTTLARNIYVSPLIKDHFDVCGWSTISQEYNAREILRKTLDQVDKDGKGNRGNLREDELGEQLYKYLIGRRYFVVMDDMWNIEAWDRVRRFFPDNQNGSRIVVTTRLSNLASELNYSNGLDMQFLDQATSWNLFSKIVFGKENCPLELENVGKKIVRGCRGLPLSIVVIGGFLSKSERTQENWGFIEENLSSIVNLEDDETCLQILYTSYNNLPVYIKPCFLYMGVFPEDMEIQVSLIIPLWVAEGFLQPIHGKSLEESAEDYIEELVDRNLLLVINRNHYGKLKSFKIHDLLRDVCLREARKLKFLYVLEEQSVPQGINSQRRIGSSFVAYPTPQLLQSLDPSTSRVRSWIGQFPKTLSNNFRLLRVCLSDAIFAEKGSENEDGFLLRLVNLRFYPVAGKDHPFIKIPRSVHFLWNLQTVLLVKVGHDFVFEIWKMPQLRHVMSNPKKRKGAYYVPDPLSREDMVLENLQTLLVVSNLKFGEGLLRRIPNIKALKLYYDENLLSGGDDYCLNNLYRLQKLESLRLNCSEEHTLVGLVRQVSFPNSLKKLTLTNTKLPWEDMKTKIGSLPLLQILRLKDYSFVGSEWETFEDQFSRLKYLLIESCDLECWITDNTHFPRLVHLVLCDLSLLKEIPSSIGDIPTLQSIKLDSCSDSVVDSARRIREEQEELGNEFLQLLIY